MRNFKLTALIIIALPLGVLQAAPKYGSKTVPLSADSSYFKGASRTDFWKLIPYYVPQHNDKACGVASSIVVINALLASERNTADGKNVDVDELFKLNSGYKKAVGPSGKGLTLDALEAALNKALNAAKPGGFHAKLERFNGKDKKSELKRLEKVLSANEKNPKDYILANFLQGVLTGDREGMIGHISPIGAYDAKKKRVLILDPDRKYYQPYWAPLDKLFDAINTTDAGTSKSRGLVTVSEGPAPDQ